MNTLLVSNSQRDDEINEIKSLKYPLAGTTCFKLMFIDKILILEFMTTSYVPPNPTELHQQPPPLRYLLQYWDQGLRGELLPPLCPRLQCWDQGLQGKHPHAYLKDPA